MFRQEVVYFGGWRDKTPEVMQRTRFERMASQLPPLGAQRLEALTSAAFERRLETCWQDVERKPMRAQQLEAVYRSVLSGIELQADCLSMDEHELTERALILGGSAPITDVRELEAARALSLRLWGNVGMVSGKPVFELENAILGAVARAFQSEAHEQTRQRLAELEEFLSATLYRVGAMDDRQPQQLVLREVLGGDDETRLQLARRYLWATFDCVDYADGVMLLHAALAEPGNLLVGGRRKTALMMPVSGMHRAQTDILPEEIPLEERLERVLCGSLRHGLDAHEVARSMRFLCKQGAPLSAMQDILQGSLIVLMDGAMRAALADMYYRMPKWLECCEDYPAAQ